MKYFDKKEDRDIMYEKAKTKGSVSKGMKSHFDFTHFVNTTKKGWVEKMYNYKRW
jgi:hypothetical protein